LLNTTGFSFIILPWTEMHSQVITVADADRADKIAKIYRAFRAFVPNPTGARPGFAWGGLGGAKAPLL